MPHHQGSLQDSAASASDGSQVASTHSTCSQSAQGHFISPVLTFGNAPSFRASDPRTEGSALCTQSTELSLSPFWQPAVSQDTGCHAQACLGRQVTAQENTVSESTAEVGPSLQNAPVHEPSVQDPLGSKAGIPVEEALFIELFAGSANLSKAFRSVGMQVIPVDTKDAPCTGKNCQAQLVAQRILATSFQTVRDQECHHGPHGTPCSTSSQARRIQRSQHDPKPLRSWNMPDGLEDLGFLDRNRVSQANRLYQVCQEVATRCHRLKIWWSIENPTSSLMWITSSFKSLWKQLRNNMYFATFHNCVYGGDRVKSTTLWTSCQALQGLSCSCNKDFEHVHKGWGKQPDGSWATSQEAAYPPGMCSQVASLVLQAGQDSGMLQRSQALQLGQGKAHLTKTQSALERASQGLFPRGSQAPPLVDPFPHRVWHQVPEHVDRSVFVPGKRLRSPLFPKGATTLAVKQQDGAWWAQVGIPVSPEEFLDLSSRSIHPESQQPILPEFLAHAVHRYCSLTPVQLNEIRVHVLKSLLQRAQELKLQEHELHLGLEPHARDVLKGKRLLLLKEMLTSMNFGDCSLVYDIMQGFRITGWLPDTKLRPTKVVIPTLTAEDLWSARTENNQRMWSLCRSSGNPELDHALWLQTLKECKAGWAILNVGLCNPPNNYVLSRRFAVQQQHKVRPIDDFSISQVNNTLGSVEKIVVMPSSSTVSLSLALQRGLHAKSPGTQSTSQVELAGKTFDLQSAYKQLPTQRGS